jgi:hypothetical protein
LTKEEKIKKLKILYAKVVDEINTITQGQAQDVRIEQILFVDNNAHIKDLIISYLLKSFDHMDKASGGWSQFRPAYERIYKKVDLTDNDEISGILMYKVA